MIMFPFPLLASVFLPPLALWPALQAARAATDPSLAGPLIAARETVNIPGTVGATEHRRFLPARRGR